MIKFDISLPYLILLLVLLASGITLLLIRNLRKRNNAGIRFSSTNKAAKLPKSFRQRLTVLPLILRICAFILLTVAIARPQMGKERVKDISKGIAIEMVVDHSGSMQAMKDVGKESLNRLDIVKRAFTEFVSGNSGKLPGRPNDLIGMIIFARYPDTLCPLTLSHGALLKFIETSKVVEIDSENATSIGDAIMLAAARLKNAETDLSKPDKEIVNYQIKSKIMILLTDGEDTGTGKTPPLEAAKVAKEWGIKIYTIGLTGRGWYMMIDDPIWGRQKMQAQYGVNTNMLEQIAKETGGIYKSAEDINSLIDVYKQIDTLEKSEISSERYLDYKELYFPFALAALIVLLLDFILNCTVLRRIP